MKGIAAIDGDSTHGSGQSKLKILERIPILDVIKNICDSWEQVKISTLKGVWKTLILALVGDSEGFKTSVEEVSADW